MTAAPDFAAIHDELRAVARDVLGKAAGPGAPADPRLIAESGWLGLEVPEALDGAGATFAEVAVVLEELGRAASRTPYLGTAVLGAGALNSLPPGTARDELLRRIASGDVVVAVALPGGAEHGGDLTEIGAVGTGEPEPPFRVERSADGLRLHGRAAFVPDATEAGRLLLPALGPDGTPVIVDIEVDTPGLGVIAQPVLDETRRFGLVAAHGAEVSEGALWRFGGDPRLALRRLLDRAAVAVACDSLGLSAAMLEATVAYAGVREQFGRPIGSFQAVKHACADMLVQVSVSRRLVAAAVRELAGEGEAGEGEAGEREREDPGPGGAAASMAKSYACAAAVEVAGKAMQLHGGMGYTWESGVHVYLKRAALNRSLFGSPTAHRRRLAARYR